MSITAAATLSKASISLGTQPAVLNVPQALLGQFNAVHRFLCWKTPKGLFSSTDCEALLGDLPGDVYGEKPMPAKPWLRPTGKQQFGLAAFAPSRCAIPSHGAP